MGKVAIGSDNNGSFGQPIRKWKVADIVQANL